MLSCHVLYYLDNDWSEPQVIIDYKYNKQSSSQAGSVCHYNWISFVQWDWKLVFQWKTNQWACWTYESNINNGLNTTQFWKGCVSFFSCCLMTFNKIQYDQMTNMKAYSLISRPIVKYTVYTRKIYVFLHYWTCYRSARLIYRIFTLNWTFHRDYLWQWRIKTHTHTQCSRFLKVNWNVHKCWFHWTID